MKSKDDILQIIRSHEVFIVKKDIVHAKGVLKGNTRICINDIKCDNTGNCEIVCEKYADSGVPFIVKVPIRCIEAYLTPDNRINRLKHEISVIKSKRNKAQRRIELIVAMSMLIYGGLVIWDPSFLSMSQLLHLEIITIGIGVTAAIEGAFLKIFYLKKPLRMREAVLQKESGMVRLQADETEDGVKPREMSQEQLQKIMFHMLAKQFSGPKHTTIQ